MDSPTLEADQPYFGVGYEHPVAFVKLRCSGTTINCQRMIPLIDSFSPLATSFEAPILAGETLYPSVEHHVTAQLLRDIQRLDAVQHVPLQLSRMQLRRYLAQNLVNVPLPQIESWRRNRMYSALKAATELKFAQYPELKALLLQTNDAFLFEVLEKNDKGQTIHDFDWGIGRTLEGLITWMKEEFISPLAIAFFTMHTDCKTGIVGSNMTGRLLMELRSQWLEVKYELDNETLECPSCSNSGTADFCSPIVPPVADEIVVLAGNTNSLTFEYPSTFVIDGRCYFSVEHFVKSKMLEEFGQGSSVDNWLADLESRKPNFFKKMADCLWERRQGGGGADEMQETKIRRAPIGALRRWARTRGVEYYEMALRAKFIQNPHFVRALLATGDSLLVELRAGAKSERAKFEVPEYCAFSSVLGFSNSGDPASFVKWVEKWRLNAPILASLFRALKSENGASAVSFLPGLGKNRLGTLLMEIRDQLKCGATSSAFPMVAPTLHQFFADFLLQLLDVDSGLNPKLKIRLHRVNSFIVGAGVDGCTKPISVDGRCNPLSVFYLSPFTADGLCFPTLEHYRWWKFFEHHSKFLQCLPGFWDHMDGRQLRAVCEQWTNENLGLQASSLIERYRTDLEFDVLRNGALSKHSQNPHILPMLFDGVGYGPIVAGESEGDSTFGIGMGVGKLRKMVERWRIKPETLALWWTSLKVVKPVNVGDNLYGLALMSARDEIFAIYCERAVSNIPMAPSAKNFNEVTSEENLFFDDLDPERLFVFAEDHPTFGMAAPVTVAGKSYPSVVDYLLHECVSAITESDSGVLNLLENSPSGTLAEKLSKAQEMADDIGLGSSFCDWFKGSALSIALKKAAKAKVEMDPQFKTALLATEKAMLVATVAEEDGDSEEQEIDDCKKIDVRLFTTGLTEDEFGEFLRDLRPSSTQILQFWTRCDAVLPGRLGTNLWAACLMVTRSGIATAGASNEGPPINDDCFRTLHSICQKAGNGKTTKRRHMAAPGKEKTDKRVVSDVPGGYQPSADFDGGEEIDVEPLLILPPMSDVTYIRQKDQAGDPEKLAALQPIISALRRCSPLFERVISSTESNEDLKRFGERLGEQMLSMFGGCLPDLKNFTDEDMYNLGRIAACQFNRSQ